mmetsp:Transcript_90793/g.228334  ORF Transcript_90793/g.228334 Transcript_90793/m.228334 type:complete len:1521 (-) Transcript_90793:289-4851(-)|eukprot:CAMPEP_0115314918 /NCGR_PEP_ID=MMETSP0270-20121206/77299_1 /TAXON_ID=71861 /ORGANISM="Scrippsiella trochoidea, Strain CCMP3099" /LENGTH=1520 /DNA_ID=CAMNT_0002734197 /DNA_START=37 /DNA_END=4599 /DNA_ORIENTATION=-
MAPKAKSVGQHLAAVQAACRKLRLETVSPKAWTALREAEVAFSLDLQVDIDHVTAANLQALATALEPSSAGSISADEAMELWDWLGQAVGEGKAKSMPRVRALISILAQVLSQPGDLLPAAGGAYLALLAAEGADQQWTSLFQPVVFRQIMRSLRGLRRGDLKQKREKNADAAGGDDAAEADDNEVEGEKEGSSVSSQVALDLLAKVSSFCSKRGLGSSAEAAALAIDELAVLVSKPVDDAVARQASMGLVGLVARAGGLDETRRVASAVIRAVLPALLMTQERLTSFQGAMPRPLQQARATALNLVSALVKSHPEALLTPTAYTPGKDEGAVEETEPPKKRGRKAGKAGEKSKEDGEGEESDGGAGAEEEDIAATQDVDMATQEAVTAGMEGATQDAGTEGEKRPRRRRNRGHGMDDPVVALLELICIMTPDRSEWRSYASDCVITLLSEAADMERKLALAARSGALLTRRLVGKTKDPATEADAEASQQQDGEPALPIAEGGGELVSASAEAPLASAAVERFVAFLSRILQSERVCTRVLATEVAVGSLERSGRLAQGGSDGARAELVRRLLVSLVHRCSDAVPTVRGKALGGVSAALQSLAKCGDGTEHLLRKIIFEPGHPQYVDLPSLFKAAAMDEKPTARKSALNLLDAALALLHSHMKLSGEALGSFFDLNVLASLSADESILVRKSCISSLSLLLRLCPLPKVHRLWVQNVLPLVLDVEATVSERALDELEGAVVNPMSEQAQADLKNRKNLHIELPPVLHGLDSEAIEYLQRGLKQVAKRNEGKLPKHFLVAIVAIVKECLSPLPLREWPVAVWSMLEEVTTSSQSDVISFDMALDAWVRFSKLSGAGAGGFPAGLGTKILRVLEQLIPKAPQDRMNELMDSLCGALSSFTAPTSMIRGMTAAIERIEATWKAKRLYAERAQERAAWRASFLKSIQASLIAAVKGEALAEQSRLEAALFSLGELAMLDMSIISDGVVTQVQTLATNTVYRDGSRVETSPAVRGQAFVALGKCCLKKEPLAKKAVELFVLHLSTSESFVVRNNVLIVLGDLCIHYTSLVDRFVPCMTGLLRDTNELLRKQAAMILASLLAEDFIKLRGSILLRFLYVLSDPSDVVRSFVECVFARILHSRNSTMFAQNFLDVICALNGWCGLANFRGAEGNEEFSLVKSPGRRAMVYRFMLSLMSSEQKFNVCAQIVTTLLAAFVDAEEATELPKTTAEPAGQTLSDGLVLLCCKEMRICFTTQRAGQEDEDVEGGGGAGGDGKQSAADATRGVLNYVLKRNMAENIIPVLVQLKTLMEARHSPFLKQLRHCLREILRDFKDDLPAMLAGDQHLAAEIAFDLQKEGADCTQGDDHAPASCAPDSGVGTEASAAPAPSQRSGYSSSATAALPQLGGHSRRISLGTMMRPPPSPAAPTPIVDADAPGTPGGTDGSHLPKARRSSMGGAGREPASVQRLSSSAAKKRVFVEAEEGESAAGGDVTMEGKKRQGGKKKKVDDTAEKQHMKQPVTAGGA